MYAHRGIRIFATYKIVMMRNWKILCALCLILGATSCKKDNGTNPDDKDGNGKPDTHYTQVKGNWEWIDKTWLHLDSDNGSVQNAFIVDGQPYAIYNVDLGAQVIQKLDYYDGASWNNIVTRGGTGGTDDFAWHQGKLYQVSSSYYGSVVMQIGNNTLLGIDTISTNSYNLYYLGSTGTSLLRVMAMPSPTAELYIDRWDGNDFVAFDTVAIDSITFGLPEISVEDGNGEIYITTRDVSQNSVKLYAYTDGGTLSPITTLNYDYGPKPKLLAHNNDLYLMEGPSDTYFTNRYKTIKRYEDNGTFTTVIDYSQSDTFIIETRTTSKGLLYTLGIDFNNAFNTLSDIMLWDGSTTKRYITVADSASAAAAMPSNLVGGGNIYLGAEYFFYNNQLHAVGSAHSGVYGFSGTPAAKVYFARYNEE